MATPQLDLVPKDQNPALPNSLDHALASRKPEAWVSCSKIMSLLQDWEIRLRLARSLNPFTLMVLNLRLVEVATKDNVALALCVFRKVSGKE